MIGNAPTYRKYREGFDRAAPDYDDDYLTNPLWVQMREQFWRKLDVYFEPGDSVLDVGCGTGIDTLHLAGRGVRVTASDISPVMIAVVEEKVRGNGFDRLIETVVMGTDSLKDYSSDNEGRFDGIISNFGPLNCESDLGALSKVFHRLLKPRGIVVASIMNRFCLWEILYYLLRGNSKKALRRLGKNEAQVEVASVKMNVFYYQPQEVVDSFSPQFEILRISGFPSFLPPLYLGRRLKKYKNLHKLLDNLETVFGFRYPFNRWGDHFLIELAAKK